MSTLKIPLKFILTVIGLGLIFTSAFATTAADADIIVAKDGSGDYTSIQAAINAVPSNSSNRTVIYLKSGLYNTEKLIVPSDKKNVTFLGESRTGTVISYHIYDCASGKCPVEDAALWPDDVIRTSATLTIVADGFRMENLTVQNTAGPVGQAQALTVRGDKAVFINCDFKGYQDTIWFWNNGKRAYFKGCLITGRTDYIYGGGIVFLEECEIRSWGGGWITAPSTIETQKYGFVFYKCQVTYADNSPRSGDDGAKIALGRPWHNYPKTTWIYCNMTSMIDPLGWPTTWNMDYAATSDKLELYEYQNTGGGADMSGRASWAGIRALTASEAPLYERATVLAGNDNWDPVETSLTKHGAGSSMQTIDLGDAITGFYYSWTGATSVTVSGLPSGINTSISTSNKTVTLSGTPTEAGTFVYTVSTVGGSTTVSHSGKFTVNAPATITYYQLKNRGTELFLDGMGRTGNGDICGQYAGTNHENSHWQMVDVGSGYYQFVNRGTGMILDGMGSTTNGANCAQWANTTHQNSHWAVEQFDGDYFRIRNRSTGMFLDGYGQTTNGADCKQYANTSHPNAQWLLVKVSNTSSSRTAGVSEPVISSSEGSEGIKVYPNPFQNELFINMGQAGKPLRIEIYSIQGKLIEAIDEPVMYDQQIHLDISERSNQFILKVVTDKGSFTQTVIKQ